MRLRLLPIVVFAISSLLVLKLVGFFLDGRYDLSTVRMAGAQQSVLDPSSVDTTPPPGIGEPGGSALGGSVSERAVLSSLGERRKELEQREEELNLREQMLAAAEARVEKRIAELKQIEARIEANVSAQSEKEAQEIKDLIKIYESMKAKSAARIFDRLEMDVLLKVVAEMQPRKMADILSNMSPEAAERLTVAIAVGRQSAVETPQALLPKIQGN
ncbi:MotE family protein [Pseudovibrio sp. SPO723]|uniref:MotE family protein n=1 Tax=Nesiotobacter zosterae TaxID=392721 RepID=UPI0029C323C6|nr:FlaA [Pseudovibrio sp. SPO723]MDX5594158.1 FlaA [Pseudovibrio sp. SPO723]